MTLFYAPHIVTENVLPETESQHAVRVLRLKTGHTINVVDGHGSMYRATITDPHPKHCAVKIIEQHKYKKPKHKLHIAIAPTKNMDRLEWFVEKCTEIGIDEITPLLCRYSERKVIKPERLEKIIVAAAKQSQKAYFPTLNPMVNFQDFVQQASTNSLNTIAHCYEGSKPLLQHVYKKTTDVLVLIGPEGDFSEQEVSFAAEKGFEPISLGSNRLRTETAGVVACHTIALLNQ